MCVCDGSDQFSHVSLILHLLFHGVNLMSSGHAWEIDEPCVSCGSHDQLCHLVHLESDLLIHSDALTSLAIGGIREIEMRTAKDFPLVISSMVSRTLVSA